MYTIIVWDDSDTEVIFRRHVPHEQLHSALVAAREAGYRKPHFRREQS